MEIRNRIAVGNRPTIEELKEELVREKARVQKTRTVWRTLFLLASALAVIVLAAMFCFPVLEIYGNSMSPNLREGDVVISVRTHNPRQGDVVAFYRGSKLLVKRVIGLPGDTLELRADGTVIVNGAELEEDYVEELAYGDCDLRFPCQVPQGSYFVMGDRRTTSLDSRNSAVGYVESDQMAGKVLLRIWPLIR